ncbi:MAG: aldehyde-activating protein [Phenylobacterium sp.]|uniref:GFA family protein n=1 Tax=Phenylobacterium sp. TaxID=1871053 RepID=UPI0025E95F53|nr:GFA family protein [Phenylobacterium sp.]MBI1197197.1 aldehyde-activating protein [Phenylobacterium sp.]
MTRNAPIRTAACGCGDFRLTLEGEPILVSACCCTRCQRRTGSFFGVTAYFRPDQLTARAGPSATFQAPGGQTTRHFCPRCGSSLMWGSPEWPDVIGVAGGAFADPTLPGPHRVTHHATAHPFVPTPDGVPVYEDAPPEVE